MLFSIFSFQPDYPFLRKVPLKRVHLFTLIQLACFALLWIIKTVEMISILFPIMVYYATDPIKKELFAVEPNSKEILLCRQQK